MRTLSKPFSFSFFHRRKRCSSCNSDLSAEDLDLKSVAKYFGQKEVKRSWEESAEDGCIFCRLITAVWKDATQEYGRCEERAITIARATGGQYLLRFPFESMTLPHTLKSWSLSTITVYLKDSNLPILLKRYKPVPQQAIDPACLKLAKQWLSICQDRHQRCDEKFDTTGPSRLIDLRGEVIKLALIPEESIRSSYVALSHCWGDAQPLQTTMQTLASFQDEIPAHELPPTFSDAIYIARALGFSHIWIDSLCIIQDDKLDWEHQSKIMASIYSNADLVLAGTAAGSADDGFLRKKRASCEATVSLDIGGSPTSFVYRPVPIYHGDIEEPLYKRGWTLQERLCARRFLAYGNWEMSWECKQSSCCELHENDSDNNLKHSSFGATMDDVNPQYFAQFWRSYVAEPYSQRLLTKPTDTPVAISALASRFESRFNVTYIAGLWREDICKELLWHCYETARPSSFFAPSWSWMSIQLPTKIEFYSSAGGEETLVRNVQTEVMPSTTNPYGPVSSGTIRLIGTLIPASLEGCLPSVPRRSSAKRTLKHKLSTSRHNISSASTYIDTTLVQIDVQLMDGTEERTTRRATREEESSGAPYLVTLLPILTWRGWVDGLILGRSATCIGAYERVGVFKYLRKDEFKPVRKDYGVDDVMLV